MSEGAPPSVRLRIAELKVIAGGTPEQPTAHYTLRLDATVDDESPPGDAPRGVIDYTEPNGDEGVVALGDVVTLILGEAPMPRGRRTGGPSGGEPAGRVGDDRGARAPARPPDRAAAPKEEPAKGGRRGG